VQAAGLRIGDVGIRPGADDHLALVRLRHMGVDGVRNHDARHHRLDRFRDQRLQRIAVERHYPYARPRNDDRSVAGGDDADLLSSDVSDRRLDTNAWTMRSPT
jgi:hypothetical protein